ncbi:hypothetical protein ABPG75_010430 [Micractinium tetrahymenae]
MHEQFLSEAAAARATGVSADVFAAGGDGALNLLWRLEHGEGPGGLDPQAVFLMIGANDVLGLGALFPGQGSYVGHAVSVGVKRCLHLLRQQAPNATLLVLGVLPIQIPTPDGTIHMVNDIIAAANEETTAYVARQCSPQLIYKGDGAVVLLQCMQGALDGSRDEQLADEGEGVKLQSTEDEGDLLEDGP